MPKTPKNDNIDRPATGPVPETPTPTPTPTPNPEEPVILPEDPPKTGTEVIE